MTELEQRLRAILRRSSSPLPVSLLAERTGKLQGTVANALKRMPDAYIVAWQPNEKARFVRMWAVVKVPHNAPKPVKEQLKAS